MEAPEQDVVRLPFHLATVATAIWARRLLFLLVFIAALLSGAFGGYFLGKRTYEARTVLRYVPAGGKTRIDPTLVLRTELDRVEIPENLAKVRFRLSLPATLEEIGAAVNVYVEEQSTLMTIQAKWKSSREAAAIANTLRDVYLENWLRAQATELDRHYSQARAELKTLDAQADKLAKTIEELRAQVAKEQEEAVQKASRGADIAARYSRLKEAIAEDQMRRANMAEMALREAELERARKLREKDLIPQAEYEKVLAAYQRQKALTYDSARIRKWREELEKLAEMGGAAQSQGSPAEMLLHATLLKSFDLDLKRVALAEKVADLREARDTILETLGKETGAEVPLAAPARPEKGPYSPSVAEILSRVLGAHDIPGGTFEIVAEAEPPVAPVKSTRKILAIGIAFVVFVIGSLALVAREILSPTVRSAPEAAFRLELPVIGVLPQVRPFDLKLPGESDSPMVEASRVLAERVRVLVPPAGSCVLLTSPSRGDGRTLVSAFLAGAFGRRGDKVLLVDAELRAPRSKSGLDFLASNTPLPGLGDLIAGSFADIGSLVRRTLLPNVYLLPRGAEILDPEPLGGPVMRDILTYLCRNFSLVIICAPPAVPLVDAGLLANWAHAVFLVIRAGRTRVSNVKRAIKRLETYRVSITGLILNGVQKDFLEHE